MARWPGSRRGDRQHRARTRGLTWTDLAESRVHRTKPGSGRPGLTSPDRWKPPIGRRDHRPRAARCDRPTLPERGLLLTEAGVTSPGRTDLMPSSDGQRLPELARRVGMPFTRLP